MKRNTVKIIKKYKLLPIWVRILIRSLMISLPYYFSAFLSYHVQKTAQLGSSKILLLHAIVIIVVTTIVVIIARLLKALEENVYLLERHKNQALIQAYSYIDRYVTENLTAFHQGILEFMKDNDYKSLTKTIFASESNIKSLIQKLYYIMEAHFGGDGTLDDRIDFEVTFMTKSYKDDKITIPAWANRDNRAPISMLLRDERPDIYDDTITAQVYKEARPICHIIENR